MVMTVLCVRMLYVIRSNSENHYCTASWNLLHCLWRRMILLTFIRDAPFWISFLMSCYTIPTKRSYCKSCNWEHIIFLSKKLFELESNRIWRQLNNSVVAKSWRPRRKEIIVENEQRCWEKMFFEAQVAKYCIQWTFKSRWKESTGWKSTGILVLFATVTPNDRYEIWQKNVKLFQ